MRRTLPSLMVVCALLAPAWCDEGLPASYLNSLGIEMRYVPAGQFVMGSSVEFDGKAVFGPLHPVQVSAFYMAKYEVTRAQFRGFVAATGKGTNLREAGPPRPGDPYEDGMYYLSTRGWLPWDNLMVYELSWPMTCDFCEWLSKKEGRKYRLPTEAEWEYAARAGTVTNYWWGDVWWKSMASCRYFDPYYWPYPGAAPPGAYPANPWGFYDTVGNADEWTGDWYAPYDSTPRLRVDPRGPTHGSLKVLRGGSMNAMEAGCMSAFRTPRSPKSESGGIRLVCEIDDAFKANLPPPAEAEKYSAKPPTTEVVSNLIYKTVQLATGVPLKMVYIPAGSFLMGTSEAKKTGIEERHEFPQIEVKITRGFYLGIYEFTQAQYEAVIGCNTSEFKNPNNPMESVAYDELRRFCKRLTEVQRLAHKIPRDATFRLPTEAEWEYACRAGTQTQYSFGDDERDLHHYAWYDTTGGPRPVGQKLPNRWGLYDMHGNVWEWVVGSFDHVHPRPQNATTLVDPVARMPAVFKRAKGGSWSSAGYRCRSAAEYSPVTATGYYDHPPRYDVGGYNFCGFRVVLELSKDGPLP